MIPRYSQVHLAAVHPFSGNDGACPKEKCWALSIDDKLQPQLLITTEPYLPDCSISTKDFVCVIVSRFWQILVDSGNS